MLSSQVIPSCGKLTVKIVGQRPVHYLGIVWLSVPLEACAWSFTAKALILIFERLVYVIISLKFSASSSQE